MQSKITDNFGDQPTTHHILHTRYSDLDVDFTPPENAWIIAAIREQDRVHRIDEFVSDVTPSLAPPPTLLEEHAQKRHNLQHISELEVITAENQAWEAVNFEQRYRNYLRCRKTHDTDACICDATPEDTTNVAKTLTKVYRMLDHRPVVIVSLEDNDPDNQYRAVLTNFLTEQLEKH